MSILIIYILNVNFDGNGNAEPGNVADSYQRRYGDTNHHNYGNHHYFGNHYDYRKNRGFGQFPHEPTFDFGRTTGAAAEYFHRDIPWSYDETSENPKNSTIDDPAMSNEAVEHYNGVGTRKMLVNLVLSDRLFSNRPLIIRKLPTLL